MFIVLEGLDGAGKSTQVARLRGLFEAQGREVGFLHFPRFEAPVYGQLVARFLRGELGPLEEVNPYLVALIYAGDRQQAAEQIKGWIEAGKVVLVDRYVYSNVAYQCAKVEGAGERGRLKDWILELEYGYNGIPRPDVTLFLDVPFAFTQSKLTAVRAGDDRDYLQGKRDIHEASLTLQQRVREVYVGCAQGDRRLRVVSCGDLRLIQKLSSLVAPGYSSPPETFTTVSKKAPYSSSG